MRQKVEYQQEQPKIQRIQNYLTSKYDLRVDVVSQTIELKPKGETSYSPINENDLMYELASAGFVKFKEDFKILMGSSQIPRYDPFRAYFEALPEWDNSQPDYISKIASYVIVDNPDWFKLMFKKHLVRTVAQALGLIQFNKQCLTFVGNQNDGKTTFFDNLAPISFRERYCRKGFDFKHKEGKFSLTQNFLINLDELASFDKKDLNNEFKSVLTESIVRFTPKFANYETSVQRRASFVATTNNKSYLTDETGNSRWVTFWVKEIIHDNGGPNGYMAVNIDHVWAQAYSLLMSGFNCEMTKEEIVTQENINRRYIRHNDEMEYISRLFQSATKETPYAELLTATEIKDALIIAYNCRTANRTTVSRALKMLGFTLTESAYNPIRGYSQDGYYVVRLQKDVLDYSKREISNLLPVN